MAHIPVLLQEVISIFDPKPGEHFIDATIGEGGHAKAILERTAPSGALLGIDRDQSQLDIARENLASFGKRAMFRQGSFGNVETLVKQEGIKELRWSGILFDFGWGQAQMEKAGRGLSFIKDEPLDMRYEVMSNVKAQMSKAGNVLTAGRILNEWSENEIEKILKEYSQERFAQSIARSIIRIRKENPIQSTFQLVDAIKDATPFWYHHRRIHPATKTFQALRIAVNDELGELKRAMEALPHIISKNGKAIFITFHSSEDRIVKNICKEFQAKETGLMLTKKPITPSFLEIKANSRARSAKLRGFVFH